MSFDAVKLIALFWLLGYSSAADWGMEDYEHDPDYDFICSAGMEEEEDLTDIVLPAHCAYHTHHSSDNVRCENEIPDFASIDRNVVEKIGSLRVEKCAFAEITRQRLQHIPNKVYDLTIDCAKIVAQDDHALDDLPGLSHLSIEKNTVAFPPRLFCNLKSLSKLYLNNNQLSSDQAFGLGECSNISGQQSLSCANEIRYLYAQNNMLTSIKKDGFLCNLNALYSLHLTNNAIRTIEKEAFARVPTLGNLGLAGNLIEELPTDTFQFATQLKYIDLSNNRLSRLPSDVFQPLIHLRDLVLSGNLFATLKMGQFNLLVLRTLVLSNIGLSHFKNVFRNSTITKLDLSDNRLETIDNDTIDGLRSVKVLNLRNNTIRTISVNVFHECPNLKKMDLSYNRLKEFPKFRTNDLVLELRLDHNEIEELNASDAHFAKGIKVLSLTHNRISAIGPRAFAPFNRIDELDLSNNNIETVDNSAFDKLFDLNYLKLIGNKITLLNNVASQMRAFIGLVDLQFLDLSYNNISEILYAPFPENIFELELNGNNVERIDHEAFANLVQLQRLELQNNSLIILPKLQLHSPYIDIMLHDNPLLCDCEISWLNDYKMGMTSVLDHQSMTCNVMFSPEFMGDLDFTTTYIQELKDNFLCANFENELNRSAVSSSKCSSWVCRQERLCPYNCLCYHNSQWTVVKIVCSNSSQIIEIPISVPISTDVAIFYNVSLIAIGLNDFQSYKNITHLSIRNSKLKNIHENGFKYLRILEALDLTQNELITLREPIFKGLFKLRHIDLSYNKLNSIGLNVFDDQKFLQSLNLANNHLTSVPVWSIDSLATVTSLALGENPWSCDCTFVIPFNKFLKARERSITNKSQLYCKHNTMSDEIVLLYMFNRTQCIQTSFDSAQPLKSAITESSSVATITFGILFFVTVVVLGIFIFSFRVPLKIAIGRRFDKLII